MYVSTDDKPKAICIWYLCSLCILLKYVAIKIELLPYFCAHVVVNARLFAQPPWRMSNY